MPKIGNLFGYIKKNQDLGLVLAPGLNHFNYESGVESEIRNALEQNIDENRPRYFGPQCHLQRTLRKRSWLSKHPIARNALGASALAGVSLWSWVQFRHAAHLSTLPNTWRTSIKEMILTAPDRQRDNQIVQDTGKSIEQLTKEPSKSKRAIPWGEVSVGVGVLSTAYGTYKHFHKNHSKGALDPHVLGKRYTVQNRWYPVGRRSDSNVLNLNPSFRGKLHQPPNTSFCISQQELHGGIHKTQSNIQKHVKRFHRRNLTFDQISTRETLEHRANAIAGSIIGLTLTGIVLKNMAASIDTSTNSDLFRRHLHFTSSSNVSSSTFTGLTLKVKQMGNALGIVVKQSGEGRFHSIALLLELLLLCSILATIYASRYTLLRPRNNITKISRTDVLNVNSFARSLSLSLLPTFFTLVMLNISPMVASGDLELSAGFHESKLPISFGSRVTYPSRLMFQNYHSPSQSKLEIRGRVGKETLKFRSTSESRARILDEVYHFVHRRVTTKELANNQRHLANYWARPMKRASLTAWLVGTISAVSGAKLTSALLNADSKQKNHGYDGHIIARLYESETRTRP